MSSGGGGGIRGYWYFLGLHMGIGRGPVNSIVEMRVGDKTAVAVEVNGSGVFPLYAPTLFGGEEAEGGVGGACYVMMGEETQTAPEDLALMLGGGVVPAVLPGFRRITSIFFNGFIGAINPYPKPWKFRVRRTTNGWDGEPWYPEKAKLVLVRAFAPAEITSSPEIHAMNPAHIFYEVMTNREWGRGLPRAALDDTNLRAVADQLFDEGFGMCLRWTRSDGIDSFVQSILDTIGAVMRPNLSTGELQLKLLRDDYVFADLPLFTSETGLLSVTEASVAAMPKIINHVLVKYKDPITGKDASVGTHNLAGVQGAGGEINTLTKEYPGLPTPDLAGRVALRDLRMSSNALRRFSLTLDRRGEDVRPGDVIRIKDVARGIPDMAVRIGKFEDGPMTDGRIRVTAVQDVFSLTAASYIGIQPPNWEAPNSTPCVGYNRSFELPYFMLARQLSAADLDYVEPDAGYLGTVVELGERPLNSGYRIAVRNGAPTEDDIPDSDTDYCPTVPEYWDGGDCVRIVVGAPELAFNWDLILDRPIEEGDYFLNNARGVLTAQAGTNAFGTITGDGAFERFLQFFTTILSDPWPNPFTQLLFSTHPDESYSKAVLTLNGTEYEVPLSKLTGSEQTPLPGFEELWHFYVEPNIFPLPALGAAMNLKIYKAGEGTRVVEACCICLEIVMTGVPVFDTSTGEPYYTYKTNGLIVAPTTLTNANPAGPTWGPYFSALDGDLVRHYSDNSLAFGFSPVDSPFLTNNLRCKVYDESDGGALVYETNLYKAGDSGIGVAVYTERPMADPFDPEATWPLIHDSPPFNPATALAGHDLRFVLSTASVCCGGLPPEPGSSSARFSISDAINIKVDDNPIQTYDESDPPTTLPAYTSMAKILRPNTGAVSYITMFMVDEDGVPLPEEDQPTWTMVGLNGTLLTWAEIVDAGAESQPGMVPGCMAVVSAYGSGTVSNGTTSYPVEVVWPKWHSTNSSVNDPTVCLAPGGTGTYPDLIALSPPGDGTINWDGSGTEPTDGGTTWSAPVSEPSTLRYMAVSHTVNFSGSIENSDQFEIGYSDSPSVGPLSWSSLAVASKRTKHNAVTPEPESCIMFYQTETGAHANTGANRGFAEMYLWVRIIGDADYAVSASGRDVSMSALYTASN